MATSQSDSGFKFGTVSLTRLVGVNANLVRVAKLALQKSTVDFAITDGLRTLERQKQLLAEGKSRTLRSRHLIGEAVDVAAYVNGKLSWDWQYYAAIAKAFKAASLELGIPIEWGGDWISFKDGPHFQLAQRG